MIPESYYQKNNINAGILCWKRFVKRKLNMSVITKSLCHLFLLVNSITWKTRDDLHAHPFISLWHSLRLFLPLMYSSQITSLNSPRTFWSCKPFGKHDVLLRDWRTCTVPKSAMCERFFSTGSVQSINRFCNMPVIYTTHCKTRVFARPWTILHCSNAFIHDICIHASF